MRRSDEAPQQRHRLSRHRHEIVTEALYRPSDELPPRMPHAMTLVEWAEVVLPLLTLGWGLCLVAMHPDAIDRWTARFDAWWLENLGDARRNRRP